MAPTTMQKLTEYQVAEEEEELFQGLIAAIDKKYPKDWRSWIVMDLPLEQTLGDPIDPKLEAKLRFAIPTDDIRAIFCTDNQVLSERCYKRARRILAKWPLGRAVLYAPHAVMRRIHASPQAYEKFMATVRLLKPKIVSIRTSSTERQSKKLHTPPRRTSFFTESPGSGSKRRASSPTEPRASKRQSGRDVQPHIEVLLGLMGVLKEQSEALSKITKKLDDFLACH